MLSQSAIDLIAGPGFLGGAIAERLLKAGRRVVCLARSVPSYPENHPLAAVQILPCDISSPVEMAAAARALDAPVNLLVHCASSKGGGAAAYERVYLQGARHCLEFFKPRRMIFAGSTSVYGQADGGWVDESSAARPGTVTGEILLATERTVLDSGGLVVRLAGLYGPGRSIYLNKMREGRAIIEDDGLRWINQIHRDDAASAILHLAGLESPPPLTNASDGAPLTQKEIYHLLAAHFQMPPPPRGPSGPRKRGNSNKRVSNALLLSTGWTPGFPSYASFLEAGEWQI